MVIVLQVQWQDLLQLCNTKLHVLDYTLNVTSRNQEKVYGVEYEAEINRKLASPTAANIHLVYVNSRFCSEIRLAQHFRPHSATITKS